MNPGNWLSRQWRVLAAIFAFLLFAPVGLFALPLAALLVLSPPHRVRVAVFAAVAGGFSMAWIIQPGGLPDQVVRAGAIIAMTVFVPMTFYTRSKVSQSAYAAAAAAVLGVVALMGSLGRSWHELHWWVEHQIGYSARIMMRSTWGRDGAGGIDAAQVTDILNRSVRFVADYHPALVTLQVIAGLVLATAVYQRLATKPRGVPLGKFREFYFTEHFGWIAIVALTFVLVPMFSAAKLGAMNVLFVLGTLYALRGVAVATTGIQQLGVGSFTTVLSVVAALLLLPAAAIGAILLGIVDTSFDLRRRWNSPPAGR